MKKTIKIIIALSVLVLIIVSIILCKIFIKSNSDNNTDNNAVKESGTYSVTATDNNTENSTVKAITYEEYNALSAEEQEEYYNSFETIEDFFAWYNQAKQEFENNQNYIDIGDQGNINFGDIIKD